MADHVHFLLLLDRRLRSVVRRTLVCGGWALVGGGWKRVECRVAACVSRRPVGGVESSRRRWEGVVLRFQILGPLEVVERDAPLSLGGAKQRAVLAILLLHRGQAISSERLINELWGERPPATAAKTLQGYVFHLRRALGDGLLHTRRAGYELELAPGQLDADEFERLAAEGRAALSDGDPTAAAGCLRGALALWSGPPLADFAYESFAQAEIARLQEARLAALEDRIDADLALGREQQLVGELDALVREHPLRERLRGQLMLALYRSGRQVESLAVYRDARETLVHQLDLSRGDRCRSSSSRS
jgi:DNA-binding SARP family transcriptional activator